MTNHPYADLIITFGFFAFCLLIVKLTRRVFTNKKRMRKKIQIQDRQKLILILDESGSMAKQRLAVIQGINQFLEQQKENQDLLDLTDFRLVKFNTQVTIRDEIPLANAHDFTQNDYKPDNMTALYDAIGHTIDLYENQKNIIVCIATDGMENSSITYKKENINQMIENKKTNHNWAFIYLSENLEKQGRDIGIIHNNNVAEGTYNASLDPGTLGNYIGSNEASANIMSYRIYSSSGGSRPYNDPTN